MTDTNTTTGAPAAPVRGTPEYDAAMAAKFRDAQGVVDESVLAGFKAPEANAPAADAGAAKATKPDNVPDKFWDAEKGEVRYDELLKSYTELEKGKAPVADPAAAAAPAGDVSQDAEVQSAVKAAGLDMSALSAKIDASGDLDEADYAALEKIGFDRATVKGIVDLRVSAVEAAHTAAVSYGGGEQAVNDLMTWAGANLPDAQKIAYNEMLAGPNWKVALDTLKALKGAASPAAAEPKLNAAIPGAGTASSVGYTTEDEMYAAMRDPRYFKQDPAGATYRAEVQEKVRLASFRRR